MKKPTVIKRYQKLYKETGRQRVLWVLFRYPDKEFSLSDLAREAGVAKPNIGDILEELYDEGIVLIEKLTKIWRIRADHGSPSFIKGKIIYNLAFLYQSGIVEFLTEYFRNPKAIVLFGSFRNGDDNSSSDIDIAIETDEAAGYRTFGLRELAEFEDFIGRKIQLHLFNRKAADINVFNNIANGIVLYGFLEVRP